MIRIGVIVAHNSLQDVLFLKEKLKGRCDLTFFTFKKLSEIKPIYMQNQQLFDAFVLNWLANMVLQNAKVIYHIPTYYYVANERDFYKKLFYISRKYPLLDFSKVTYDFENFAEFMDFDDLNEVENVYKSNLEIHVSHLDCFYEDLLQKHLHLHKSSAVELSITAFSNIYTELSEQGVKVELITASKKTIVELFEKVILEVQNKQLLESNIVIGKVTSDTLLPSHSNGANVELNQSLMYTLLLDYSKKNALTMIIQKQSLYFEIITSKKELLFITSNFTKDALVDELYAHSIRKVNIGWGIGQTIDTARKKADIANHEAQQQAKSSLIIIENNQLISPNSEEKAMLHMAEETPELHQLSEKLNISLLLLQKIVAVIHKTNTNIVSSDDIALYLGITIRSANRILNELESKGVAEIQYKKHEKLRGRPKKFYKINFHNK